VGITRHHDARGRLTMQEAVAHPASSLSLSFDSGPAAASRVLRSDVFDYRPDGYLVGQTTTTDRMLRRQFELDAAGRITSVVDDDTAVERYSYDALSNIVTQTATAIADDAGRREYRGTLLVRDGRTQFHYDDAGRLIRKVTTRLSRKPDVWQYRYDAFDQMVEVSTPDGAQWRYSYDALGRRTAKSRLAVDGSVAERTVFTWDATTLVEQSTSDRVTRWTYRPGTHTPLTQASVPTVDLADQASVDAEFYAIVTDLVGTPTELVDPGTADVAGWSAMSLWGSTSWTGAADTPIRFPGQYFDDETGLHYNLHRYYDPVTARYATMDPLGLTPSPNPNSYPHNPTVWSDPLGLTPCRIDDRANDSDLPGLPDSAPSPAGHGSSGRTEPFDLHEQLAMTAVRSSPESGRQIPITLGDGRWPSEDGWVKWSQNVEGVEIHYTRNNHTGQFDDFKFAHAPLFRYGRY